MVCLFRLGGWSSASGSRENPEIEATEYIACRRKHVSRLWVDETQKRGGDGLGMAAGVWRFSTFPANEMPSGLVYDATFTAEVLVTCRIVSGLHLTRSMRSDA